MAGDSVTLTYKAEIKDLRDKLSSIPDITAAEARKAVQQLDKQLKAAERAQKDAAKASEELRKQQDRLRESMTGGADAMDAAGGAAVKLRGLLGSISPEAGNAAGAVDDMVDALEGVELAAGAMGVSMGAAVVTVGALAQAVGVGYLVWKDYNEATETAKARAEAIAAAEAKLAPILDATSEAVIRRRVAEGELSKVEAERLRIANDASRQFTDTTREAYAEVQRLTEAQAGWQTQLVDVAEGVLDFVDVAGINSAILDTLTTNTDEYTEQLAVQNKIIYDAASAAGRLAAANIEAATAETAHAAATSASAAAKLADAAAIKARQKAAQEEQDFLNGLNDQIDADNVERSKQKEAELQKQEEDRKAELAAEEEKYQAMKEAAYEYDQMVKRQAEEEAELREEAAWSTAESVIAAAQAMTSSQLEQAKEGSKAQARLFKMQQGLAIAGIAVDTAKAVTSILATYAAVPPVAAALSAAAIATGAVQAGIVASQEPPTFHAGGLQGSETIAKVLPGEMVVDRSATAALGGPAGLRDLMGGGGGGGTVLRIGRAEVREMIRTDLRSGGLVAQIGRSAAKRSTPAGRSGRGPLA